MKCNEQNNGIRNEQNNGICNEQNNGICNEQNNGICTIIIKFYDFRIMGCVSVNG